MIPAPGILHNHPFCPWDKRTRRAKAAARAARYVMDQTSGDGTNSHVCAKSATNKSCVVSHSPNVVGDKDKRNSPESVALDTSNPTLLSESSISTALMAQNYPLGQFYS